MNFDYGDRYPLLMQRLACDVLIVGGGTGGCAAALTACRLGLKVVMTEPSSWFGGQLTSQAVPPDEHPWIETRGSTTLYREYRTRVRDVYRARGLKPEVLANPTFNPGGGWVSRLCHEPAIGAAVLETMLSQYSDNLVLVKKCLPRVVEMDGRRVKSVWFGTENDDFWVEPRIVLDATETGDLLPLTDTAYRLGAESKADFNEPHALDGPGETECVQGITWCAAIGYDKNGSHVIEKPEQFERWRNHIPAHWTGGNLLSFEYPNVQTGVTTSLPLFAEEGLDWFSYRQIVNPAIFVDELQMEPATIMNWPQNDMWEGTILDVSEDVYWQRLRDSRELTLSVLYWLQTECGYPGLRLRPDLTGTSDGLAMAPYIRESRRIQAVKTVTELDVSAEANPGMDLAPHHWDSIAVGSYRLDLHPRANGRPTIDLATIPFEIPLGSLVPVETENLIPCCKNIGVTHIANGCTRLHPIEWGIGEAAAVLAAACLDSEMSVQDVYRRSAMVEAIQGQAVELGIEGRWQPVR